MNLTEAQAASSDTPRAPQDAERRNGSKALKLILLLRALLDEEGINYCHWKSNESLARSATGDNDLDLLIDRSDAQRFAAILHALGFKEARPPPLRQAPGVVDFFGLDTEAGRLVHVHAHYQLIVGDDTTKNYRLPIEKPYLASSIQGELFRLPESEFEFVVLVIRMVLKHSTWDAIVCFRGRLAATERRELEDLLGRIKFDRVDEILGENLSFIDPALLKSCLRALQPGGSLRLRLTVGRELQRRLAIYARRPPRVDTLLRLWRRFHWRFQRYILKSRPRKTLVSGGALIAIVGADGAGKSTAVAGLSTWLSGNFATKRVHLGKPPRSAITMALKLPMLIGRRLGAFQRTRVRPFSLVGGKSASFPGKPWLIWHLFTARDRRRAYLRARRFATKGGFVVSDRYPLRQIRIMDGAVARLIPGLASDESLSGRLARLENACYEQIMDPDVLVVLRVGADVAVDRRSDEDEEFVRARCREIENANWDGTSALIVDANRPAEEVLSDVKRAVWSRL